MRNWLERSLLVAAIVLGAALAVSHTASAVTTIPPPAPEIDPAMLVAGLGVAGGAGALIWERLRRRR